LSISWSRILPLGTIEKINQAGIDYYNRVINDLIENGIEPMITLYHFDLPQPLSKIGGWLNEDVATHFADLARVAYENFGDRVKTWITFNEVVLFCTFGYGEARAAPGILEPAEAPYKCVHTAIKAHALAYRAYEDYREKQQGKVGITLDCAWFEPRDRNNADDVAAMHRALRFWIGWVASPLYFGEYPSIMRQLVDKKSTEEGRNASRLPSFDNQWAKIINGSLDFLGLNHYTTHIVYPTKGGPIDHNGDSETATYYDSSWPKFEGNDQRVVPWGLRRLLVWVAREYGNPDVYVTENGYGDKETDGVDDQGRVNYYRLYINEVLKAARIDGVNIKGYTAWSLLDNFEWREGYTVRYGTHYIDYRNGNLTRVAKASAKFLSDVIRNNGFPSKTHRQ
jgi:lactase-phlorizin hydrolase